jgi:hypothetical protein
VAAGTQREKAEEPSRTRRGVGSVPHRLQD